MTDRDQSSTSTNAVVVLAILSAAIFINVIDTTIMNVSISALVDDLGTTVGEVQGAITLYTLTMAAFMLTGGKLGDIWGSKRAFRIGLLIDAPAVLSKPKLDFVGVVLSVSSSQGSPSVWWQGSCRT